MFPAGAMARAGLAAPVPEGTGVQEGLLALAGTGLLREKRAPGELGLSLARLRGAAGVRKNKEKLGWREGEKLGIKWRMGWDFSLESSKG